MERMEDELICAGCGRERERELFGLELRERGRELPGIKLRERYTHTHTEVGGGGVRQPVGGGLEGFPGEDKFLIFIF
jgi:hypothetical protein